jgi:transposase
VYDKRDVEEGMACMKYVPLNNSLGERIEFYIFPNLLGKPRKKNRECFETIRTVLITGIQWCNIPNLPKFLPKFTVHDRFQRWVADGFFDRLLKWLSLDELEALSLLHLDATVKVPTGCDLKGRPNLKRRPKGLTAQGKQNDHSHQPRRSAA